MSEHFPGCHPEHDKDDRQPDGLPEPGEVQECWHCATPVPQGCTCAECLDADNYVPHAAMYHCPVCKRWWATMLPVITKITFREVPDAEG